MKISATGSGGFAGLTEHYEIDTDNLPEGKALEKVLDEAGFFSAQPGPSQEGVGADLQRWQIVVSDNGREHVVTFVDDGSELNARWQNIVSQLRAAA